MAITFESLAISMFSAIFGVVVALFIYRIQLESRLKDLEHKMDTLTPIICVIRNCGIRRVEKKFEDMVEESKGDETDKHISN